MTLFNLLTSSSSKYSHGVGAQEGLQPMKFGGHTHSVHKNRCVTKDRRGKIAYSRSWSVQSPLEMGKPKLEEPMVRTGAWQWVSLERKLTWEE